MTLPIVHFVHFVRLVRFVLLLPLFAIVFVRPVLADEPLHPSIAFKPTLRALDGQTIEVRYEIAPGYYLYRDKFRFSAEPATVRLGAPLLPKGKEKVDDTFGKVEVYYREVAIRLPVERDSSGPLPLTLTLTSQGCADAGVCYPPHRQTLTVELPDPGVSDAPTPASVSVSASASAGADESGQIARWLGEANYFWACAAFFGFGLLLSLTPCVFPMIPILSGIIVGAKRDNQRIAPLRGLSLSGAYVFGMATVYAAVGVAAGLSGSLLFTALQTPWVVGAFALVFVALAASMFGLYELQLPARLQSRFSEQAGRQQAGSLIGVGLMGAISALIAGPCVAAPLAGALLYIGQTGDAVLGGAALFCLALGMGAPLLAVGASAGTLLPRSGPWMDAVKTAFGFVMLATALSFVSPFLPIAVQMGFWSILLIVPAILLRAIDPLPPQAGTPRRLFKAIGILLLLAGAAEMIGAFSGAQDPLRPLVGLRQEAHAAAGTPLSFTPIRSLADLDAQLKTAGTPVMLDFYADWCVSCKEMDRYTFADSRVRDALAGWTLLQADVTANTPDDQALLARFRLFGPPGILFFDAAGRQVDGARVVGFQNADRFLDTLRTIPR